MSDLLRKLRIEQLLSDVDDGALSFVEYQRFAVGTDKTKDFAPGLSGISFLSLGLFGEVGSLLSELKKKIRDKEAYSSFRRVQMEEFGDVLWYLSVVASRSALSLQTLVNGAIQIDVPEHPYRGLHNPTTFVDLMSTQDHVSNSDEASRDALLRLGSHVGQLLDDARALLKDATALDLFQSSLEHLLRFLLISADAAGVSLAVAAEENIEKTVSRWPLHRNPGGRFDALSIPEEQFPNTIDMAFRQKTIGSKKYVYQSWRGVNIGDRLTDNFSEEDDFRFHDVFHLSYYAVLGWSPVLRALLRLKRKSEPKTDEVEDGARAILIEEGVATWIFNHSKELQYFANIQSLDYSLLKAVQRLVVGYQVQERSLWEWESAILQGFQVFRELQKNGGGVAIADLEKRTISYEPLS